MRHMINSPTLAAASVLVAAAAFHLATSEDITFGLLEGLISSSPVPTSALDPCPPKSMNCIRTTWTAPVETTPSQAKAQVQAVFRAYPQEGQAGVDKGGWGVATGTLEEGKFRIEYQSGKGGFFSRLLNGGKPFIDDVLVEIVHGHDPIVAEIRSSSRMGVSDMGVNQKRLQYLARQIQEKGWRAPPPEYPKN